MKTRVTIKGDAELFAALRKLRSVARAGVLAQAAQAGMLPINNSAAAKAPYKSGTLRRSIHIELVTASDMYAEATSGTDVEYAARQEFGFHDRDSLGREYHQSARPYMRPAYEENKAEATDTVRAALLAAVMAAV